jgi:tetratricopeptide (TPR) repeat protein
VRNLILLLLCILFGTTAFADDRKDAEENIKKANEFLEAKDWQKALSRFEIALKLSPELKSPYYGIGLAYQGLGDCVKATEAFRTYLDKSPTGQRVTEAKDGIDKCKDKIPASQPVSLPPATNEAKVLPKERDSKVQEVPTSLPKEKPDTAVEPAIIPQANPPVLDAPKPPVALYGASVGSGVLGVGGFTALLLYQLDANAGNSDQPPNARVVSGSLGGVFVATSVVCLILAKKHKQSKTAEAQPNLSPAFATSSQ